VNRRARVLLPEFGVDLLARELEALGFPDIVRTKHAERLELDGLAVCERASRRGAAASRSRSRLFVTHGPRAPEAFTASEGGSSSSPTGDRAGESGETRDRLPEPAARSGEPWQWTLDANGEPCAIELPRDDGSRLSARVLTRVPVYRVVGRTVVKVTFGTAVIAPEGGEGRSLALFERTDVLGAT